MLASLTPREELAYRLALRGMFPRVRARRDWDAPLMNC
jgi:hypothetical protein